MHKQHLLMLHSCGEEAGMLPCSAGSETAPPGRWVPSTATQLHACTFSSPTAAINPAPLPVHLQASGKTSARLRTELQGAEVRFLP